MMRRFVTWVISHRMIVIGVIGLITIFFVEHFRQIEVVTRFKDLLPKDHPFIMVHTKYEEQLGDPLKLLLMLQVKEGDIYNAETLEKAARITKRLDLIPGVNHNQVYSIGSRKIKKITVTADAIITENLMKNVPRTQEALEGFKGIVRNTRGVYGVWVSPDERSILFTASFIPERMDFEVLYKKVQEIVSSETDSNHIVYAGGEPLLAATVHAYKNKIYGILALSVFGIILTVYLYFRNMVGTVVPVTCALLCSVWGLGFTSFLGYNIDPLGLVIPLLIAARALSHSVQMTERYFEEYHEVGDVKAAVINAMEKNIPPGAVGIATDCLGILLIAVAPVPMLQKMAFTGAFWAGSNVINGLIFSPVLLSFFKPPRNIAELVDTETGKANKIIDVMARAVSPGRNCYITFAIIVLIAIFAAYYGYQVKLGDVKPGSAILWPDSFYNVSISQINKSFPGTDELYVIVEGDGEGAARKPEFLKILNAFQRHMETNPLVTASLSVSDLLPPIQRAVFGGYPKMEMVPKDDLQCSELFYLIQGSSAPGDFDHYFDQELTMANVIVWYKDHMGDTVRSAIATVEEFIARNQDRLTKAKVKFQLGSGNVGILAAVNETVEDSQLLNFMLIMIAYFGLTTYTFKTIKCPLLLSMPLNLSNLITLTIMHFMGIGLNINTLPIVSLGIGVGDDYGLYVYSRIGEEYAKHKNYKDAFNAALKTSGKAVFFTATTMAFATISWYFISDLRFQAEMGLLLAFIMGLNMVLAMIMIPCLMYVFRHKPRRV